MTIATSRVNVTSAGTLLHLNDAVESQEIGRGGIAQVRPRRCYFRNAGAAVVYVGDSNVGTATGYQLGAGTALYLDIEPGDAVYGMVVSGTVAVEVLRSGD